MDEEIVLEVKNKNNSQSKTSKKNSRNKKNKKKLKNNVKGNKVLKILGILIVIIISIVLILSSKLFEIKNIEITGNSYLSNDKVISFSKLQIGTNLFSYDKNKVEKNIKENAYIESVKVHRKIPSTILIDLTERKINYMLQFADSYVYINNQGYMLEISNEKKDVPILVGLTTDLNNVKAGNRIDEADLKRMDTIIKIYETARVNEIEAKISKIDISNEKNYILYMETEGKKIYLGDSSNLNTKMLYLKSILDASTGRNDEIFLNVDLNVKNPYSRPIN